MQMIVAIDYYARLRRVKTFVETNLSSSIRLCDAANIAGLEPKYFSTFFRNKTGICFSDWLKEVRITRAVQLLSREDLSILELAIAVGFSSERTFRRVFKSRVGTSPSTFRKTLQAEMAATHPLGADEGALALTGKKSVGEGSHSRTARRGLQFVIATLLVGQGCGSSPVDLEDPIPPQAPVPIYGLCDQHPNYSNEVILNRWPTFPLSFYFDAASFPAAFLSDYRSETIAGMSSWNQLSGGDLGAITEVENPSRADFMITYKELLPAEALGGTRHSTGTPFLAGGEIAFNKHSMREGETLASEGAISRDRFREVVRGVAAHEMGHLLGIIGHPRWTDVLMGPVFHDAPSAPDINTLSHAYCRSHK